MSKWRAEHFAHRMRLQMDLQRQVKLAEDPLMLRVRRRRHIVLPVDELMPLPIVWEEQEVVVGELHAGAGGPHVITLMAAGHALIVASSGQMDAIAFAREFGCNSRVFEG